MNEEAIRLNKYLSEKGICSRREADRLIENGEVLIDGAVAEMGQKVLHGQKVEVKGQKVKDESEEQILLLVNKPKGIICTSSEKEHPNIIEFLNYKTRIYPIGRLDKDSRGLLLMTNQGDLVNKIMRARNYHEKEYIVTVDKEITSDFISRMKSGIYLKELDETTRPCKVKKISKNTFSIILTQGLNRQIRRMCEACGYRVRDLQRIRIMNLKIDGIKEGSYRKIDKDELNKLLRMLGE